MIFNELLTMEQFQQQMIPKLKERSVGCAICGKTFDRLSGAHLKTHKERLEPLAKMIPVRKSARQLDIERDEFPGQIPEPWSTRPEKLSETYRRLYAGTDPLSALIDQTFRLYHPKKTEWLLMDHLPKKEEWTTVKHTDKGWPWHTNRLSVIHLREHFLGQTTIGVHAHNSMQSKVLVFDVDGYQRDDESPMQAKERVKRITRILVRLLRRHRLEPHVVASGSKGYHVCLYFHSPLSANIAFRLFQYFVQHPDLPTDGVVIECLPFSHGIKLPLGINWKAKRFCSFVDPLSLIPISDPYQYLLSIQPMDRKVLQEFVAESAAVSPRQKKRSLKDTPYNALDLATAFYEGIQSRGSRHTTTLQATAYCMLTDKPETHFELLEKMLIWSKTQYDINGPHIKTPWYEHERDLMRIVKYAWEHPLSSRGGAYGILLTTDDVHWIRSKTDDLKGQRLLLAALYQSRLSGDEFHLGFERMRELTGLTRDSLSEAILKVRDELGILEVVKNYSHQTGFFKSHTTKYRLTETPNNQNISAALISVDEESWSTDLWFHLLKQVFSEGDLKKSYPHAAHRILKSTAQVRPLAA